MGNCNCGGGAISTAMTKRTSTACSTTSAPAPAPVTTDANGKCQPSPWKISCETQNALADCLKQVICQFLISLDNAVCATGQPDFSNLGPKLGKAAGAALCGALECIPAALCPPQPAQPQACDDLPCNFAVEEPQA